MNTLYAGAASFIARRAREAIKARGRFAVTLCGGSTIGAVYRELAEAADVDWSRAHFFWGDERFVDPDNPYSNFRLASESLFSRLPGLPAANIHPVPTTATNPAQGARQYSAAIQEFFDIGKGDIPSFDLCINGMGPDGHTASLFPHLAAVTRYDSVAVMSHAGLAPWVDRVTMTLSVFNAARSVLFIAAGAGKAGMLRQVLEEPPNLKHWPSGAVKPASGDLTWIVDESIAAQLQTTPTQVLRP